MRYFLVCLLAAFLLAGCKDECLYSREPELAVLVIPTINLPEGEFNRVYSPDGREVPFRGNTYFLPLSLHADSVTYLFESPGRVDSLTIFYTRRFFFESEKCGYVVEMNNFEREDSVRTTFGDAEVIFENRNRRRRSDVNEYVVTIFP